MSLVVLGTPPALPGVIPTAWEGYRATLTSWDGTTWDVSDYRSGLFLTRDSLVAFGMPPVERRTTSSAAEAGARYRSHRVAERSVILPLFLYSDAGSLDWVERDAAFWRAMHPDKVSTLRVQAPGQTARSLRLRFTGDDQGYEMDPVKFGWARYVMEFTAEQPFWEGDPIVRSWEPQESQPFFGGDLGGGFGPPFYISSGQTLANARIDNPGDVEAYAVWEIEALDEVGISSVTVGVGGRLTTAPFLIPQGQTLTIDPRPGPRGKSAYDSFGNRRTPELSARDFAPIPAGSSVPLSLAMVGQGKVTATLVPRHYRAWG